MIQLSQWTKLNLKVVVNFPGGEKWKKEKKAMAGGLWEGGGYSNGEREQGRGSGSQWV